MERERETDKRIWMWILKSAPCRGGHADIYDSPLFALVFRRFFFFSVLPLWHVLLVTLVLWNSVCGTRGGHKRPPGGWSCVPSAFAPDNNHIMLNLFLIPPAASHLLCFISKYHRIQEHVVRVVKRRRAKQIVQTDRWTDMSPNPVQKAKCSSL